MEIGKRRVPRPETTEDAIAIVKDVLEKLQPGPETFAVYGSRALDVLWDHNGSVSLDGYQRRKLEHVRNEVKFELQRLHVLHQIPDLMLVTRFNSYDTGAIRLWDGTIGRVSHESSKTHQEHVLAAQGS